RQALDDLEVAMSNPGALASFAAARAVYGAAPYGAPLGGTKDSLAAIGVAEVSAYHHDFWRPDNATLVLTGDITPEQGFAIAERQFGAWSAPAGALRAEAPAVPPSPAPRVIVIDLPQSGQAAVAVTRLAMNRSDPRYYEALVANNLLGGGYS